MEIFTNNISSANGGPRAAFYTLGCRVNQYETQAIEDSFRNAGFEICDFDDTCDVYVINTCTVTAESDRKSRQIIRRTALHKKENSIVIVCGCYSQGNPQEACKIEGVDLVLGNSNKSQICSIALEMLKNKQACEKNCVDDISKAVNYDNTEIFSSDRTRAFIKIVDGCENHCTYCIIPSVRGKIRSRNEEDILSEVERLANKGYREFVLTGIETAAYGKDREKLSDSPLAHLIEKVAEIGGVERIRLGSMEPTIFTQEFVKRIAEIEKLMPHFHLSLQSGSASVLRNMKRKYNPTQFADIVKLLRKNIQNLQITTDIIVGFPGESEKNFNETVEFIKECQFSYIHIFPYSARKGTPAACFDMQIEKSVKKARVLKLEEEMLNIRHKILTDNIGKTFNVLLETQEDGYIDGYTENYLKVKIKNSDTSLSGKIRQVKIVSVINDIAEKLCLEGELI